MDPHRYFGNLVSSLGTWLATWLTLEKEGRPGQQAEKAGDSSVKDINGVVAGTKEISIDKELVMLQALPRAGEGSGQSESDKHTLSRDRVTYDEGEEIAKECLELRYFSLDSQTDASCMDESIVERYFTEVQETMFLDSHEFQPPTRLINPSEFKIGKQIGEGGQATIHEAHHLGAENANWVLKVFKAGPGRSCQGQWPEDVIFNFSPFLCMMAGYILQSDGSYALVMSRYDGDLRTIIDEQMRWKWWTWWKCRKVPFSNAESMNLCLQIAMGMKALHAHGFTHRDLKTSNVLIKLDDDEPDQMELARVNIGDFECSSNVVGTGFWRSPEVLQALKEKKSARVSEIYTPKSDVYSFGMTCYEILTGKIPLDEYHVYQYDVVLSVKKRPQLPEDLHPKWKDLICRCWHQDPDCRPTFTEIVHELKKFATTLDEAYGLDLVHLCGFDEGFGGEGCTLEADLNNLQVLLQANQKSLSVEGFACGCDYVLGVNRFQQHFGFGITDDMIVNDEKWWELFHLIVNKVEGMRDELVAIVDGTYVIHLLGRIGGHLIKLMYESLKRGALENPLFL